MERKKNVRPTMFENVLVFASRGGHPADGQYKNLLFHTVESKYIVARSK